MVATRRGGVPVIPPVAKSKKTPAAKSAARPKKKEKKETYGRAKFLDKTDTNRTGEKTAKETRERRLVESPFKVEVPERIKLLKSLKKMIQKIVTGAEVKRCPKNNPKCTKEEMVKGPYLVSLSSVQQLAEIIKLTPHDGPRGKRMQKLQGHRAAFFELQNKRKQLVRNLFEKNSKSRTAYLNTLNIRPGSKEIAGKAVVTLGKRKMAAAKAKDAKETKRLQAKRNLKNAVGSSSRSSAGSSSTSSVGSL